MKQEYTYTGKAFGTDFAISFITTSEAVAQKARDYTLETMTNHERQFSRFQTESELSRLNHEGIMEVTPYFMTVLCHAYNLFTRTHGIFNPLVQVSRIGYTSDFSSLPSITSAAPPDIYSIDFTTTTIDRERNIVVLQPGQQLDFGGFLKGYLADTIAHTVHETYPTISGVIINFGGDIATRGYDIHDQAFAFSIWNPIRESALENITVDNTCIATSGTYQRNWIHENTPVHHLLDSTGTKNPETAIVSASVLHTDGGTAEAYAKVVLAIGPAAAEKLLAPEHIAYLTIDANGIIDTNFTHL